MAVKKSRKAPETVPVVHEEEVIVESDIKEVDLAVAEKVEKEPQTSADTEDSSEVSDVSYSSDDSEDEQQLNTVGAIPMKWYAGAEHIGYDLLGRKIAKSLKSSEVDALLRSTEDPNNWRTVTDAKNDREIMLTDSDLAIIRRLRSGVYPSASLKEDFAEFADKNKVHPETYRDPSKDRFLPCKWESKTIRRLVKMIRSGKLNSAPVAKKPEVYDIWAADSNSGPNKKKGPRPVPAPKMPLPDHSESYHPPEEFLFDENEHKEWEAQDWSLRKQNFVPRNFQVLRHVPNYLRALNERYERCLDLFTLPRRFKSKMNVDPESLIPTLPPVDDLRPFPQGVSVEFPGMTGGVCLSASPCGQWLVGGEINGVKIWDVLTGRAVWERRNFQVTAVSWGALIAIGDSQGRVILLELHNDIFKSSGILKCIKFANEAAADWSFVEEEDCSILTIVTAASLTTQAAVSKLAWHHKGKYLCSVSQNSGSLADSLFIHSLSGGKTLRPFGNKGASSYGKLTDAVFHSKKPWLMVSTQRGVRIVDLKLQKTEKTLNPGNSAKLLSALTVHPSGDHIVAVSEDRRLVWFDLDLGVRPWRVLKNFQEKAMMKVSFHPGGLPLLAVGSDDGTVQIFHARVFEEDLSRSPLLVPVKRILASQTGYGRATDVRWHPTQPWLFTAADDGKVLMWA